ncbi:MAG: MotA/TolQ/ExbB proton channel family protein [Pirellulaceae bacterium]
MSKPSTQTTSLWTILGSLGWPLVLGGGLTASFYALLYRGPLDLPLVHRYFAGHPINMVETTLFFVGLVALVLKLMDVFSQNSSTSGISLGEFQANQPTNKCGELLDVLSALPAKVKTSYLGKRLIDALETVERKGTAEGLDEELKYLSDMDASRQQDSYALVRIIIWATPMLGFLGTVVGITDALGDLAKQDMGNLNGAMKGLLSGLYVAFDTTAIALCFSMVLMFIQFMIDRMEVQLLSNVDHLTSQELLGRFATTFTSNDPQVAQIQRMGQAVVQSTELLVKRQAELWQNTIAAAHDHWQNLTQGTTEQMQSMLTASLDKSLAHHATHLAQVEAAAGDKYAARWEQWQLALSENARLLHAQQQEMVRQGELMTQAIKAAGDVVQLEAALNKNLSALAGSQHFEETVMSLSAAIHLLSARVGSGGSQIELKQPLRSKAA